MADEDTTSAGDTQAPDDVGTPASDEASGNTIATAELDSSDQTGASETSEETKPSEASTESEAPADDNSQDDFKDWAAKKNLPLDDPEKLGRMYRDLETKLGSDERKDQLKTAVDAANTETGADDIQSLKNQVSALSFYVAHPEAQQYESKMVEILDEKPWLAGDLDVVLEAAKGRTSTDAERLLAERQAGKKEALETAAHAERGAPPRASATTRETIKEITDADVANMSQAEYEAWKNEGNNPWTIPTR